MTVSSAPPTVGPRATGNSHPDDASAGVMPAEEAHPVTTGAPYENTPGVKPTTSPTSTATVRLAPEPGGSTHEAA